MIVDESTGRLAEGRKWRDGVHQAVEAKEGLTISLATTNAAQITVQQFFRLYPRLAGMTGTAVPGGSRISKDVWPEGRADPHASPLPARAISRSSFSPGRRKMESGCPRSSKAAGPRPARIDRHTVHRQIRNPRQTLKGSGDRICPPAREAFGSRGQHRRRGRSAGTSDGGDQHGRPGDRY